MFDIHTSKDDLLTKLSAFNPYPEKAGQGFLVSRTSHPMTNPAMWIKYLSSGQVYYVHAPLSYPIAEVTLPEEEQESKVPCYYEKWMSLDDYVLGLSRNLVDSECFSKAKLGRSVQRSVVAWYSHGLPLFKSPPEAHLSIVKEALRLIEEGDYHTAFCFVDYACRTGAYTIDGEHYSDPSFAVFEYTGRELAWEAVPSLRIQHFAQYHVRGRADVFYDTAHEVQSFCILSTRLMALRRLRVQYEGVAREHFDSVISLFERFLCDVVQKLMNKRGLQHGITYYDEVLAFLSKNDISL
ncbi:MAG: hypothetical protein UW64_C0002G0042 [Microgenomates group bacterium GW2011_GWC1_44_37]|uniref:Uncharacterized protein n=1 Tax=Candidatus Collierbacteria bacterium GW2011_GWB2_44_22 TaxID=1618387 RepID=A0A0G1HYY4_9BACT|nr:MAG: hypothetical protein UW31_C0004G0053 [Candidatus Collierbacteria bacterium GW2011_GWA2_44_13]KKT52376.1 MAG: hypothetical protein UW44_C0002G0042 [Candidatus Collierbacteria bacterium GW2011_GWB2_44_22]KKT62828.1 MAG: hypothetical protein UW56_C0003G0014 [Candidatus Collierbacteria bacterium GW2011_GWD1_44_27]KKT64743.1 MAG: hypothetical protein UW58_C0037G0007 [Candidatus Collierbacteria bacterium GW2011_GWC2_44_30]KKT69278.1 MAG: hypothetical protein UW64_C0002G0042 [Microgenomates gr